MDAKLFSPVLLMILGVILIMIAVISMFVNPIYIFWTVLVVGIITLLLGIFLLFFVSRENKRLKRKIKEEIVEESRGKLLPAIATATTVSLDGVEKEESYVCSAN